MDYLWIGLGGFAGANARYVLGRAIMSRTESPSPYGTFVVNVTGSLLIGVLLTLLTDRWVADPAWRLVIIIGFLGCYTTFSSYTFEAVRLFQDGQSLRALTYVVGSNVFGLVACYLGIVLAKELGA